MNSFATINYSFKFNFLTVSSAGWNSERNLGNEALEMTETETTKEKIKEMSERRDFYGYSLL